MADYTVFDRKTRAGIFTVLCFCIFLLGCETSPSLEPTDPPTSVVDPQLEYADRIPGFGGLYVDEGGRPKLGLTEQGDPVQARATLAEILKNYNLDLSQLMIETVAYDFRQLHDWGNRVVEDLFSLDGIVHFDIDEANNRISVGVETKEAIQSVTDIAERLQIPSQGFFVEVATPYGSFDTLASSKRPVVGGLRITQLEPPNCTSGFNVRGVTKSGVVDNRPSLIINAHCTTNLGLIFQSGSTLANLIGVVIDNPEEINFPWPLSIVCASDNYRCRWSDSARVLYVGNNATSALAGIARPVVSNDGSFSPLVSVHRTLNGVFRIVGERSKPLQGMQLDKVGVATGWTQGTVSKTCATLVNGSPTPKLLLFCQGVVTGLADNGDSGAPVFSLLPPDYRTVELNGILWGGNGTDYGFSPMINIERELGALTTFTREPTEGREPADLVPEPEPEFNSFCRRNDDGDLVVRVRNQSNQPVLTSTTTRVVFSRQDIQSADAPPIPGGGFADLIFDIPGGCFDPDCEFTLSVDADLEIEESHGPEIDNHEINNIEFGRCIG